MAFQPFQIKIIALHTKMIINPSPQLLIGIVPLLMSLHECRIQKKAPQNLGTLVSNSTYCHKSLCMHLKITVPNLRKQIIDSG